MINVLFVCWIICSCIKIAYDLIEIYEYKKHEKDMMKKEEMKNEKEYMQED